MSSLKTTHRWCVAPANPEVERDLVDGLDVAPLVARIMASRGISSVEEGRLFLTPSLERDWQDPMIIPGMPGVVDRVERAVRERESIAVFGDFDVDGITSTCLLTEGLRALGADVQPFIPHRFDEGYGISQAALDRVVAACEPSLIVTVDNGIAAREEVSYLTGRGIDLVVTDHHEPSDMVPQGVPLTDPKLESEGPSRELAGAGVALKLVQELGRRLGQPDLWRSFTEVAALGTVSDMMPLTPENRALVADGIARMRATSRPGYIALAALTKTDLSSITADALSFSLIPRLNAAGRMDSAVTALQLVLCEDPDRAEELAHKLNEINAKRQETELQIFKAAEELLEQQPERLEDRVILLWGRDWHPGVIGIVASRLVERTGRPVIVVTVDEHGECKGSGRSVQGFNLHACIGACADLLIRYGGHAMAAGLSVREENLEALRRRLNEWAARECPVLQIPPLTCDLSIHLDRVTVDAVRRLDQLAPFGAENPTPVFLLQNAVLDGVYPVSDGKHSRLRLRQGSSSIYAVWFGMHPEQVPYSTGDVVDAAISLSVYDSPRGAQLSGRIIELHPAGLGNTAAEQAALVQALRRGTPLTPEQKESIAPERSHIITVYRELQARRWHAEDLQPLFAKLGEENPGRTLVAVAALEQVGLITAADRGGAKFWELVPATGKKNLADAPILKCLEER